MPTPHPRRSTFTALVLVLALLPALAACTGGGDEPRGAPKPTPTPTATEPAPTLRARAAPYDVAYRRTAGKVARARRDRVLRAVTRPVRGWIDGGFVDGPWPRHRFRAAFGPFTGDAAKRARGDARLLSLQALGPRLQEVVPQRRRIRVAVTAVHGRAVGATAAVDLRVLGVDGRGRRSRVAVRGDLYLTPTRNRGWQIFGYDLDRWVDHRGGAAGGGAA